MEAAGRCGALTQPGCSALTLILAPASTHHRGFWMDGLKCKDGRKTWLLYFQCGGYSGSRVDRGTVYEVCKNIQIYYDTYKSVSVIFEGAVNPATGREFH